jgi:formylglycine-generating enzyme required for sulfatase activity/nucleoside phosphorylase
MVVAGRAVILTAKQEEFLPICEHLRDCQDIEVDGTIYTFGIFIAKHGIWEVFVVETGMGSEEAAVFTAQAILNVHPDVILFVGIAGGFKSKVAIGDVVIADYVYAYESGKQDSSGFYARPHSQRASHRLEQRARAETRSNAWRLQYPLTDRSNEENLMPLPASPDAVHSNRAAPNRSSSHRSGASPDPTSPDGFVPRTLAAAQPKAIIGPIATGAKVLASQASQAAQIIRLHYNDTLAIEMEGSGFHKAAHLHAASVDAIMIRGISDMLDGKTETDLQGYQELAARHAAAFTFAMLSNLSYNGKIHSQQHNSQRLSRQIIIERDAEHSKKEQEERKRIEGEKQTLRERLLPISMRPKGFVAQSINGVEIILPPIVNIPAGPFIMGSDKRQDSQAFDNEMPRQTVVLETFEIALYPLTVAEYACFVQATQHPPPNDWSNQQEYRDHPVVWLSWRDACAYVQWLAQVSGQPWRLPNEAEWEKAARGNDGRIYPWGNSWNKVHANTNDGGPKGTTPVGSYPEGCSPYGVYDMAGNVLEWTSSLYRLYPYEVTTEKENTLIQGSRVLRGGAWNYSPGDARAAYRDYGDVDGFTNFNVGVRVARGEG